ncbi:MAG: hypothetical protein ACRDZQ_06865 [Acidimicrobiales bacterium]
MSGQPALAVGLGGLGPGQGVLGLLQVIDLGLVALHVDGATLLCAFCRPLSTGRLAGVDSGLTQDGVVRPAPPAPGRAASRSAARAPRRRGDRDG